MAANLAHNSHPAKVLDIIVEDISVKQPHNSVKDFTAYNGLKGKAGKKYTG